MAVLVHELGHVFGLRHSCKFPECDEAARRAVMYPYPLESDRTLLLSPTRADRDALGAVRLRAPEKAFEGPPSQRRERHQLRGR
jgi:hypothetical protein